MMKRMTLLLADMIAMAACLSVADIKSTEWQGVDRDENTSIAFGDSTCEIYKRFETGYVDTIKVAYNVYKDTISFVPFNETVTIGSKLIVSGNELKESITGITVFKLK